MRLMGPTARLSACDTENDSLSPICGFVDRMRIVLLSPPLPAGRVSSCPCFRFPQEPEEFRVEFKSLWKGKTVCPFRNAALDGKGNRRDGKRLSRLSEERLKAREEARKAELEKRPGLLTLDISGGRERVVRAP